MTFPKPFTNRRRAALQGYVVYLYHMVQQRSAELNRRRLQAFFLTAAERAAAQEAIAALAAELETLRAEGRAATFDLLVSGISHRQFMQFANSLV